MEEEDVEVLTPKARVSELMSGKGAWVARVC